MTSTGFNGATPPGVEKHVSLSRHEASQERLQWGHATRRGKTLPCSVFGVHARRASMGPRHPAWKNSNARPQIQNPTAASMGPRHPAWKNRYDADGCRVGFMASMGPRHPAWKNPLKAAILSDRRSKLQWGHATRRGKTMPRITYTLPS